jgi:hypothetical protein
LKRKERRERKKMSEKSEGMKEIEKRVQKDLELHAEAEKAKVKTLAEILSEEDKPQEVFILDLGCKIKAFDLKFGDFSQLAAEKDPFKLAVKTLMLTWGRADSSVTEQDLARLGLVKCIRILEALGLGMGKIPLFKPTQT